MYFVHIYDYIFANIYCICILRSCPDIKHFMCSVCVSVRTHTHTHTYTHACVKNRKTQDDNFISPSIKNQHIRQATSALHKLVSPSSPTRMNKLRTHEHMCTPSSDCIADMYGQVKNIRGCTHLHALDSCFKAHHAHRKNAHTPAQARLCDSATTPSPCKPLRPILQPKLISANKTTRFHNRPWRSFRFVATQASSDHTPLCCPAGPIQFVYHLHKRVLKDLRLVLFAFITGNGILQPLLEGLFAEIHIDLSLRGFGRNQTRDLRMT